MPFTLRMEEELFVLELNGTVTTHDFKAMAEAVLAFEREQRPTPSRLTDMSGVTALSIDYDDIDRVARMRRASPPTDPIRSAIFAPTPVQFGMARMFQTLNNHPNVTVEVFRDRAAALDWLRETGPTPP